MNMVTLKLSYLNSCTWVPELLNLARDKYPLLDIQVFNEDSIKERKKAFALKNTWATRMSPFAILISDDVPIKAFYSEDGGCTLDNILNTLNSFIVYGSKNN